MVEGVGVGVGVTGVAEGVGLGIHCGIPQSSLIGIPRFGPPGHENSTNL